MQQTIIHPYLRGALDARNINWFPYCTGRYTDEGQQELLDQIGIHKGYIAWSADAGGRVDIAYAGSNIHLLYPDYVLSSSHKVQQIEKTIITHSFVVDNAATHERMTSSLFHLLNTMHKLVSISDPVDVEAWTIGKTSLESRNLWVWGS